MVIEIIFLVALGLLVYSYLLYPGIIFFMDRFTRHQKPNPGNELPTVSIIMSVYNEEIVIEEKLNLINELDYPPGKLEVIIGSDNSTDRTNAIIEGFRNRHSNIKLRIFENRTGKPAVINHLVSIARGDIIVITDADVMIQPDSLKNLVAEFSDPLTGLADSVITGSAHDNKGISIQERTYLNLEGRLKQAEGRVGGFMMGPAGGFYAIRRELFTPVPDSFLVDDFFIAFNILLKGFRARVAESSLAWELINDDLKIGFRRKVRISAGNFQNLAYFSGILLKPWKRPFIPFVSHKVIRWTGPQIYIVLFICNCLLIEGSFLYLLLFLLQLIFLILPPLDIILKKFSINLVPLRFITHFFLMNIALLAGFWRFLKGIDSGIWEPTKRIIRDGHI